MWSLLVAAMGACGLVVPLIEEADPTYSEEVDARPPVDPPIDAGTGDVDASAPVGADAAPCPPGHVGDAGACVDVVAGLHRRRLETRCIRAIEDPTLCRSAVGDPWTGAVGGAPGTRYRVSLRVRGVVELAPYDGGTQDDTFYAGGEPAEPDFNVFHMSIGGTDYYFNAGSTLGHAWALDYVVELDVAAGDELLVEPLDEDVAMLRNADEHGRAIVIPEIEPAPQAFNGQFIQLDVEHVEPRTTP